MNVIEKLLGSSLTEDLTESTWWTETVFRELERGFSDEQVGGAELAAPPIGPEAWQPD